MIATIVFVLLAFASLPATVECAKKASGSTAPAATPAAHEPVIEEVTQKQLERILQEKDYVAVYWCKCKQVANQINFARIPRKRKKITNQNQFMYQQQTVSTITKVTTKTTTEFTFGHLKMEFGNI